jgi:hypothetical protein
MGARQPLQYRPNPPAALGQKIISPSFPILQAGVRRLIPPTNRCHQSRSQLPPACGGEVPDTGFDFAPLWQRVVVSKAKDQSDADKPSIRGSNAYDKVLYRLGIDVNHVAKATSSPKTVYETENRVIDESLAFPHLSNEEEAADVATQLKHLHRANESTRRDHTIRFLLPLARVPDPDSKHRILRPLLVSENAGALSTFERVGPIEKRHYYYVRHADGKPLTVADIRSVDETNRPFEGELRFRSDHHMMAWSTVIKFSLRAAMLHLPGVCMKGLGCAPFLSIEHKPDSDDALTQEAFHQAASSSYRCLVERQRLTRDPDRHGPYVDDDNMRHYAYLICGLRLTIYVTTVFRGGEGKLDNATTRGMQRRRQPLQYTGYHMQCLAVLNLGVASDLLLFRDWHRAIVSWGLDVYVNAYEADLEHTLGATGRPSALELFRSVLKVTCPESLVDTALEEAQKLEASLASERSPTPPNVSVGSHDLTNVIGHTSPVGPRHHSPRPQPGSIHSAPAVTRRRTAIPAPRGGWCRLPHYHARPDY